MQLDQCEANESVASERPLKRGNESEKKKHIKTVVSKLRPSEVSHVCVECDSVPVRRALHFRLFSSPSQLEGCTSVNLHTYLCPIMICSFWAAQKGWELESREASHPAERTRNEVTETLKALEAYWRHPRLPKAVTFVSLLHHKKDLVFFLIKLDQSPCTASSLILFVKALHNRLMLIVTNNSSPHFTPSAIAPRSETGWMPGNRVSAAEWKSTVADAHTLMLIICLINMQ